jgi:hypothetical protein
MDLGLWGAIVSTALAVLRIWEFWQASFRLQTTYSFTSSEEEGNKISIHNLSSKPVIINYWELWTTKGYWPFRSTVDCLAGQEEHYNLRIDSYSSLTLTFAGYEHFNTNADFLKGKRIFLKLYIPGRLPKWVKVYVPYR